MRLTERNRTLPGFTGSQTSVELQSDPGSLRDILMIWPDAHADDCGRSALALLRSWASTYRVHVVLLSADGPLLAALRRLAVDLRCPAPGVDPVTVARESVRAIAEATPLAFAVTVSVRTVSVLDELHAWDVPSLTLVTELASLCVPVTTVSEVFARAERVVVPARMVVEDALASDYMLGRGRHVHVIPFGPDHAMSDAGPGDASVGDPFQYMEAETARLRALLRPDGLPDRLIVLGTGPVCHAAGVDLFLDIARIVLSTPASRDALFVWSGPGYDPRDGGYGALLQKRLRHTGLESRVILLPPTSASAALNGLADIVILPARADPLSLSGVAALRAGRPVLCFENGCSLAEYLEQDGLADPCLAPYLDVSVLADRILTLAAAPDRRAAIGARGAALAVSRFGPRSQARTIAALALSPAVGSDPETDAAVICESPTFDPAFCGGAVAQAGTRADAARAYLYAARTGFGLRKPEPGFNPAIFADLYGGRGDPYADFLRARRPAGPWSVPVIRAGEDSAAPSAAPLRAALHIHAYHPDQLADIAARLACNAARPDLFVSVADAAGLDLARAVLADGTQAALEIRVVPNVGRDIGPLLTAFGPDLVAHYDIVGHVHTKQTRHSANSEMVRHWVNLLLSGVIGGPKVGAMMDSVLAAFAARPRLGLVHPEDPRVFGWGANRAAARWVLARTGHVKPPEAFNFPVGTMFWMRAAALAPFVDLELDWRDYPAEPLANDGTLLHALERLFGVVPRMDGWDTEVTVGSWPTP